MSTRGNGEGTIYTVTRNGKPYYRAQISNGYDENGKPIRKSFSGYVKKDVVKKMNEYLHKQDIDELPTDEHMTLEKWFFLWLFEFRVNDLKPSSFERYEGIYRNYIKDSPIGKMKLVELRAPHMQRYYNSLLSDGISIGVVRTINSFISTSLKEAIRQGYINRNYCQSVKLPRVPKKSQDKIYTVFTKQEQEDFTQNIKGHPLEAAFIIAMATGIRLGELLALRWDDIDLEENTLNINSSIRRVTYIEKDGTRESKTIEQSPKTESSIRVIPFPSSINSIIRRHRIAQNEDKLKLGELYADSGLVFANEVGLPLDTKLIPRNFQSVLKDNNMRVIKFHSLRHTYATRLFESNVPVKTVQMLMGHSNMNTTMNIYTHVMPEEKEEAVEKLNELFKL